MASFVPAGSGGVPLATSGDKASATVQNVSLASASTEYVLTTPAQCVEFTLRARQRVSLQIAYTSGQSGTQYLTLAPGCVYQQTGLIPATYTIYVQSPSSGSVVELEAWTA